MQPDRPGFPTLTAPYSPVGDCRSCLSCSRVRSRCAQVRELPAKNGAFTNRVPMVVAERARLANDSVTRNDERERICANRASDRARRGRLVDRRSQTAISRDRAGWNTQEGAPHAQLKWGTAHKRAQMRPRLFLRWMHKDLVGRFLCAIIISDQLRIRPLRGEQIARAVPSVAT